MEERNDFNEVDEAVYEVDSTENNYDAIREAANENFEKIRYQAMVLGYRVACQTIVQMLAPCLQPNVSRRELERKIKSVIEFAGQVLPQPEETAQN